LTRLTPNILVEKSLEIGWTSRDPKPRPQKPEEVASAAFSKSSSWHAALNPANMACCLAGGWLVELGVFQPNMAFNIG